MAYELYQTLNIPTQSSTEEIRRSYYRLVRKHSPEKDPERFKLIREAYETLSDSKAKQNYDSLQQHGGEIIV
ncbi:MAG: J domain-containing protein, partial [Nostoc sp.]